MKEVICPYCGEQARLVTGDAIYPGRTDLHHMNFWLCKPCNAYVGCHKKHPKYSPYGETPLGTLANEELRNIRKRVHSAFDPMWKTQGWFDSRKYAYKWLAFSMNIKVEDCHIGMFDVEQCRNALSCIAYYKNNTSR